MENSNHYCFNGLFQLILTSVLVLGQFQLADLLLFGIIFSCFFECLVIFDWMPDIMNFAY